MLRSALLSACLAASFATSAHAGSVSQPAMSPFPNGDQAPFVQPVGLRRCPLGAVQCMGGFVQRCVERWGDTMWMTSGQCCSG